MASVKETIQIDGKDVEVYKIEGHPTLTVLILANTLSKIDEERLKLSLTGTIKGRNETGEGGVTFTGDMLHLYQANLTDVNKFAYDYFSDLLTDLDKLTDRITRANVASDQVKAILALTKRVADLEAAPAT